MIWLGREYDPDSPETVRDRVRIAVNSKTRSMALVAAAAVGLHALVELAIMYAV